MQGHNAAAASTKAAKVQNWFTYTPSALWDPPAHSCLSLPHSICEWINLPNKAPYLLVSHPLQKKKMSQAWGLRCTGTSARPTHPLSKSQIMSICRGQLVPMCASAELCQDILVKMICLLWGSREDVEKTAPSQLLQGVLQCRGVTEKYSQSVSRTLPPFPGMLCFFPFLIAFVFLSRVFAINLLYTCTHRLFRHWLYFDQSLLQRREQWTKST